MPSARLILVRHAESEGNAAAIMQGAGEYPLTEAGRRQAEQASAAFERLAPTFVASSHLSRAVDTALLATGKVDHTDSRLREREAGMWEGVPRAQLEKTYPGCLADDSLRPDGFEPDIHVFERMMAACADLFEHDGTVVAFTHGAALRVLDRSLGGKGARFAHLEGFELNHSASIVRYWTFLGETQ